MPKVDKSDIDLDSIRLEPCSNPQFIKVKTLHYTQTGEPKTWEVVSTHDSVGVLLIDESKRKFVFVKQFRATVFLKNQDGITYELCAGIVDKNKTLQQIAKEEVLEECGYDVPLEHLHFVRYFYTAVGSAGSKQHIYFAFIDESMKVTQGGGIEGEYIEVVHVAFDDIFDTLHPEVSTTPSLLYAVMEYLRRT